MPLKLEAANNDLEPSLFPFRMTFVPLEGNRRYCGIIEEELGDKLDELSRHLFRVVRDSSQRMGILINDYSHSRIWQAAAIEAASEHFSLVTKS